eukprot:g6384.t1
MKETKEITEKMAAAAAPGGGMNQWQKGLFNCCDQGIEQLLCTWCFGACAYGRAMERLQIGDCLPCCLCGAYCRCCNRKKIREVYGIQEDPNDILASFCCAGCAHFQELQEIALQENLKYGFLGALRAPDGGELPPPKKTFTK